MDLNLKNPLAFFDLETTGVNVSQDRIVEISILKVNPNKSKETKTMLINPGRPIPPETSEIHGIKDEDVKDAPTFKQIAKELATFIKGCDLAGFNSNRFDIPLLVEEFLRADIDFDVSSRKFVDVQVIFHKKEQRTLSAAYKFYCKQELTDAHSAEADTKATYEILLAQLDHYSDLENDVEWLSKFSSHNKNVDFAGRLVYNDKNEAVFNFGKYKGQSVDAVFAKDPSYYAWMMNADFPLYTKKILTEFKLKQFGK